MIKFEEKQWSGASILLLLAIIPLIFLNGGFDNLWVYVINAAVLIGLLVLYQQKKLIQNRLSFKSPGSWFLLLLIWGFLSVFWSVHPHRTLVEAIQLLLGVLVYWLARNVDLSDDDKLIRLFSIAGAGAALFSTVQYLVFSSYDGTLANANPFAIMMVMLSLMCWGSAIKKTTIQWGAMLACGLMLSQVLVFSSRMSLLAGVISVLLLFWKIEKQQFVKKIIETVGVIILTILFAQVILAIKHLGDIPSLTATVVNSSSLNRTFFARISFFRQAFRLFLRRPIQGYGLGTFFLADNIMIPDSGLNSRFVHNYYLQVLAELGVTGFVFLIGVFVTTCIKIWRQLCQHEKHQQYGYIAMFVSFSMSIFSDMTFNFPVCLALFCMAVGFIERDTIERDTTKITITVIERIALILALIVTFYVGVASFHYQQIAKETSINSQITKMSQTNKFYPINSRAHLFVSKKYEQKHQSTGNTDDLDNAILEAEKAVRWCPVDGASYEQLGQLYLEADRIEEAEQAYILARDHAGTELSYVIQLAYFYMWQNEMDQAKQVLTTSINQAKGFTEFEKKHAVTNYIEQMTKLLNDIEEKE